MRACGAPPLPPARRCRIGIPAARSVSCMREAVRADRVPGGERRDELVDRGHGRRRDDDIRGAARELVNGDRVALVLGEDGGPRRGPQRTTGRKIGLHRGRAIAPHGGSEAADDDPAVRLALRAPSRPRARAARRSGGARCTRATRSPRARPSATTSRCPPASSTRISNPLPIAASASGALGSTPYASTPACQERSHEHAFTTLGDRDASFDPLGARPRRPRAIPRRRASEQRWLPRTRTRSTLPVDCSIRSTRCPSRRSAWVIVAPSVVTCWTSQT